ncbi:hypothetical protein HDU96_004634 [Phlyctochytrium bullatum]|nr:hypothetical protein HDU96_004634 [Phlyctochytrium bullatum]
MSNITSLFFDVVEAKAPPDARKAIRDSRHKTPSPVKVESLSDGFLREAYDIFSHILALKHFLTRIKPVYLDAFRHRHLDRTAAPTTPTAPLDTTSPLAILRSIEQQLAGATTLADAQRTQVDLAARTFVEAASRRIKALEMACGPEAVAVAASRGGAAGGLLGMLGLGVAPGAAAAHEARVREHRQGVVWLLQKRLMDASVQMQGIQGKWLEMRAARQLSLSNTQKASLPTTAKQDATPGQFPAPGGGAVGLIASVGRAAVGAVTAAASGLSGSRAALQDADVGDTWAGGWDSDDDEDAPAKPKATGGVEGFKVASVDDQEEEEEDEEWMRMLPGTQRTMLEREHELLQAELQSGLEQVRNATQSLQEISSLHAELAFHLQEQEKTIQRLHEEAVVATHNVESANVYLNKAYKNFGDSRLWLIVFFAVSTLSLLFLDWFYS